MHRRYFLSGEIDMGIFNFLNKKKQTDDFDTCLLSIFDILSRSDEAVTGEIRKCISDTPTYFAEHQEAFDKRGMEYSFGGEKWIKVIAAVEAMEHFGYAVELDSKADTEKFEAALADVLAANHIEFSLENINFNPEKSIPDWAAQFNEYAGQSGITVMFIDIASDCYVLCAAKIADYAEAAEIASQIGLGLSSRAE